MNNDHRINYKIMGLVVLMLAVSALMGAQILTSDEVKKAAPNSFFFDGQSATTQVRNTTGLKTPEGKLVLAGLVDTTGYSTAIAEKYQGFLIAETKLSVGGTTLEPGEYGFGFKGGKFIVMNVAATEMLSTASQNDDQLQHPVPLKLVKDGTGYRLYAGRKYVVAKVE